MATYYQILGLSEKATAEEIKKSFRRLAMTYHPDRNKSPDAASRFIEIQKAYDILSDEYLRSRYDQQLRGYTTPVNVAPTTRQDQKRNTKPVKKPRDINAPFSYYSYRNFHEYSRNFETTVRVILLAIPGFFVSLMFLTFFENVFDLNVGDYLIPGPFLIFHLVSLMDCFLPLSMHYALLMGVSIVKAIKINELVMHVSKRETGILDYFKIGKEGFIRDCFYVKTPPEAFKNMQQFAIFKSFIFRNNFQFHQVLDGKLMGIVYNEYKVRNILFLGMILLFSNGVYLVTSIDNPLVYIIQLIIEYVYITYFFTSNKIITTGFFNREF